MRKGGGRGVGGESSRKWRHKARSRATENAGHAGPNPPPHPPLALLPYPMDTASRSALNQHFTLMNDDQCPGAADVLLLLPLLLPLPLLLLLPVSCVLCTAQRSMQQQQGQRNQNKARVPAGGRERNKGEQCKTETRGAALKCTKGACPKRE